MPMKMMDAGSVLRTVTGMKVADGGLVRTIRTVKFMDGTTLRTVATFAPPMTLSISPSPIIGVSTTSTCTAGPVTATPSGGVAPYSYAWTRLSHSALTAPTITSPSTASTSFVQTGLPSGTIEDATFRCTVTDAAAQTAAADVIASFQNQDFS